MFETKELNFIIDKPAKVDFLDTHTPVASAISYSIISEPKLKVIGLLGRWGSGKSTIVKEVEAKLESAKESYLTFTYDAWLHQNNPLRRSFLESLVQFLNSQDDELIDDELWETKLKKLSGELEVKDEYETPIVTSEAKLFFILAFFLTFGLSFLGADTFRDAFGTSTTRAGIWTFWVGVGLVAVPIIVWLLRTGISKLCGEEVAWFPALILNKKFEHVNRQTYKPIEPTSIEFGRTFRDLMQTLKSKGVLLVVVIDNIDRIDETEALRIWASVRSFFLSSQDDNNLEFENYHPTVVLPIDSQSIAHMFAINSSASDGESAERLARSFVNKTFDVTFDVPAPVTSDWKRYLKDRMKYCFGNEYTEKRYFRTRQYLESWFERSDTQITPREINKTLNRIVAMLVQRNGDEIPFETIAYFSINKDSIYKDIESEISKQEHPLSLYNEDWALEVAALHFGVNVNLAAQVLMTDPIRKAIKTNSPKLLESFRDVVGFGDIFEQVTADLPEEENVSGQSILMTTNAALLLNQEKAEGLEFKQAWINLVRTFNSLDGSSTAPNLSKRISVFYDHVEAVDADDFVRTVERIVDTLISVDEIEEKNVADIGRLGTQTIEFSERMGVDLPIFDIESDAKSYLNCSYWMRESPDAQLRLRTSASHNDLVLELVRRISAEGEADSVPSLIATLTSKSAELMLGNELESIEDLIVAAESSARSNPGESELFAAAMKTLAAPNGFLDVRRAALDRLGDDNTLSGKLDAAAKNADERVIAIILAIVIWKQIDVASPTSNSWTSLVNKFPSVPSEINHLLDELYADELPFDILFHCHNDKPALGNLVSAVVNDRVKRGVLGKLNSKNILSNLSQYSRMMDSSLRKKFADELSGYSKFWPNIRTMPWSSSIHDAAILLKKEGNASADKITVELSNRAKKSTVSEWNAAIMTGSEPYKIVTEFLDAKKLKLGINSKLALALIKCTGNAAAGGSQIRTRWFALSEILTGIGRRKVMKAMSDAVFALSPSEKIAVLKSGGERFLIDARYHERPDKVVENLILPLVKSKKGREWLNDRATYFRPIVENASESPTRKLTELIHTLRKSSNEEKRHWSDIIEKEWRLRN